jgi:SAM-dependent methyltransferase
MNSPKPAYEWFSEWFDSPYYHLLYFHRDEADASNFINALIDHLKLRPKAEVLDLACGRGRHAIYLASFGYRVAGLDLSPHNIELARKKAGDQVHFKVHDMRDPLPGTYDLVLNLFTSFGYFNTYDEHLTALKNIYNSLKPGGYFILDYLNAVYVEANLVKHNTVNIEGVEFELTRRINGAYIEKDILIRNGDHTRFFQEKVRAFSKVELTEMAVTAGFNVEEVWGNYEMNAYDKENSPRMILKCSSV